MLRILKQSYPLSFDTKREVLDSWIISLFVFVFLLLFQPFGLAATEQRFRLILIGGYTLICFFILLLNLILVPRLLPSLFKEESWTVLHRIVWYSWIVFSIGLGNYLFACILERFVDFFRLGIRTFLLFEFVTLVVSVFPIAAHTLWNQNRLLKKHLKTANLLSHSMPWENRSFASEGKIISLPSESDKENVQMIQDRILFLRSAGNYVDIHYFEDRVRTRLIRNSLSKVARFLSSDPLFFRCHRAYIVNIQKVKAVTGNTLGLRLDLEGYDEAVPVSRGYVNEFKKRIEKIAANL